MEKHIVIWWGLLVFAVMIVCLLLGELYWISTDPENDDHLANKRVRAEREWREMRRPGWIDCAPAEPNSIFSDLLTETKYSTKLVDSSTGGARCEYFGS